MAKTKQDLRTHLRLDRAPENGRNPACLTRRVPVIETRDIYAVTCDKCKKSTTYARLVMARNREG
jgi:hypothetical protein